MSSGPAVPEVVAGLPFPRWLRGARTSRTATCQYELIFSEHLAGAR
ncbi:hypothetical protein HMPREF0183_2204 [Brevibacterium mcbrellneri ATCC 49030]|uniref:Uncharacterized protein n=1 Tax=Brevibacterium mcbrellneri ATCC 49030 TaxID=585530 RepID=D4YQJ4_9MICO|nr:hypothetical protein HMPREF0183_2204 [Brevibacterium mcbrellneri ATCC 49030]